MDIQLEMLLFFQSIRSNILNLIFLLFSVNAEVVIVFLTAYIYWCANKKVGQKILFSLCGNIVLNSSIKEFIKAPRPIGSEGLKSMRVETAGGYSFPSMHTHMTTAFWYSLATCFKKRFLYILAFVVILGVGISRLYLAVHWPIDIIFGWIFGLVFTIILGKIFDYSYEYKSYKPMIFIFIIFLIYALYIQSHEFLKLFGVYTGFLIGYIIENKYINFSTDLTEKLKYSMSFRKNSKFLGKRTPKEMVSIKIKRLVIGLFTLGILYIILKLTTVFITEDLGLDWFSWVLDYIRYTVVVFYAIAGVPKLFKIFKLE